MNLFFRELRTYRNSTIIWVVSFVALLALFLSIYPSFSEDVNKAREILSNIPPLVMSAAGFSVDSFFSIYGFMAYIMTFIALAGAVQAMNLGTNILSKEENSKTADFLLTRPIGRFNVVSSKVLAGLAILLIVNIVFCVTAVFLSVLFTTEEIRIDTLMLVLGELSLIQIFFFFLGIFLSNLLKKIKSSIAVTLPVVFGIFAAGMIGAILEIEETKYIIPFKYFNNQQIIESNGYDMGILAIGLALVVVMTFSSYVIFIKKDIKSAS